MTEHLRAYIDKYKKNVEQMAKLDEENSEIMLKICQYAGAEQLRDFVYENELKHLFIDHLIENA